MTVWALILICPALILLAVYANYIYRTGIQILIKYQIAQKALLLGLSTSISLATLLYSAQTFSRNVSVALVATFFVLALISTASLIANAKSLLWFFIKRSALPILLIILSTETQLNSITQYTQGSGRLLAQDRAAYFWPTGTTYFWLISPLSEYELNAWISITGILYVCFLILISFSNLNFLFRAIFLIGTHAILVIFEYLLDGYLTDLAYTGVLPSILLLFMSMFLLFQENRIEADVPFPKKEDSTLENFQNLLLICAISLSVTMYSAIFGIFFSLALVVYFRVNLAREFRFLFVAKLPLTIMMFNSILLVIEYYRRYLLG